MAKRLLHPLVSSHVIQSHAPRQVGDSELTRDGPIQCHPYLTTTTTTTTVTTTMTD
ncbi:hypothetical protein BDV26DRAFT_259238 [Aspergillus bertholletiae]|uniref:Uncharacterized protein n=1 Tax=Aspergillus bertholletiae TaxID=1226010 RepID=A0A5N7BCK8_9EURO|nr:hypothetical protein BDV26DRAFT_259238 [Aspergillus bertholletiae]